ncbi:MAG TPA: Ig-like domain-containing protein [Flavisolibacter sp.]|nr:Ig-like domain-containing protein [Flavisolibacter sp.]
MVVASLFGTSCANIIPPQGGPRDSIPPQLLSATPRDSTLNFRSDRITLTFNEYIDLQDVQNNLLFTPLFQNNPRVDVKGKTINIHFRDTLEPNTTYIFNFGNAIKDYNEGNVLKNFTYTFSTGPVLDSLELKGKVVLAQTGKTDSTLIVVLHKNLQDSAVMKQRPMYVTKVDASGNFRFHNLPAGTFAVYALSDAGTGRKYINKTQLFAFADSPVHTGVADTSLILYAYREVPVATTVTANPLARARAENRLIFTSDASGGQQDLNKDLSINFGTALKSFDSTKIALSTDSSFNPVSYTVKLDSSAKVLTIHTPWKEATRYNLVLNKDFAADSAGKKLLKTDTLTFLTKSAADYGNVSIRLRNIDLARNPVLLFVQNDQVIYSAAVKSGTFSKNNFVPGDYELRILYDTNDNGKWDPGQFFGTKKQPELVKPIDQKITIKPNWDNEFER